MKVCSKPCKDCPWKKTSAKGWLGGQSSDVFTATLNMGQVLPCHNTHNKDVSFEEIENHENIKHCRGSLITMNNSYMLSKNPKIKKLQENIEKDESFFKNLNDFKEHHENIGVYSLEDFLNSEDWENFVADIGNDEIATELYKKVVDKAKCKGCGSVCEDIDQYYETYHGGVFSSDGYCIYCLK